MRCDVDHGAVSTGDTIEHHDNRTPAVRNG
jgi:hypothetical protein